jgi:glutathione peroxidase-family protein
MKANKRSETTNQLWTPARLAFTTIVLFLVAAFGISSCSSNDERRPTPSGPGASSNGASAAKNAPATRPPAPAPLTTLPASIADAELLAVTGNPIKLSSYTGKVLVVNLWATWCGPCRAEIPELVKLYNEFRSNGLEVVGLSTEDPRFATEKVRSFVADFDMTYRVGFATNEVALGLMQGRDSIPQSFVISRDGQIVKRFVGFNPTTTPPQIREAIEQALAQKAAD